MSSLLPNPIFYRSTLPLSTFFLVSLLPYIYFPSARSSDWSITVEGVVELAKRVVAIVVTSLLNAIVNAGCLQSAFPACSLRLSLRSAPMASVQMEELTSGASGRIIPVFRNLRRSVFSWQSIRRSLIFIHSIFLWLILLLPRHRLSSSAQSPPAPVKSCRRRLVFRRDEEDTQRRRALAEGLEMVAESGDGTSLCRCATFLFYGTRRNALFCRSWFPVSGELK